MDSSKLAAQIESFAGTLSDASSLEDAKRQELLRACDELKSKLETPFDVLQRVAFAPFQTAAVRIGINMQLFDILCAAPDSKMGLQQLADAARVEPLLLLRMMRVLTGMGIFHEIGPGEYASTPFAKSLLSGTVFRDFFVYGHVHTQCLAKLPDYFIKNDYRNPSDAFNAPFQYVFGTELHFFEWLKNQPEVQSAFNSVMQLGNRARGEDWYEYYPVEECLYHVVPTADDFPLLVDIGGGVGRDLQTLKMRFPSQPGRFVLQDLPVVLDSAVNLGSGIDLMPHDFFQEQPIKGARVYCLKNVLHDWPDAEVKQILKHVSNAMNKDSILLVQETCLPESRVSLLSADLDLIMMMLYSSLNRTEKQWIPLLESEGLDLIMVWRPSDFEKAPGALFELKRKR